ncbi:MAG: HD-GYP domain-containing protein [Nitrospirota bacterium]
MTDKGPDLRRLMFSMASLADLGEEATSAKRLSAKMRAALYVITGMFSVPGAALFVYHPQRHQLELLVDKGHRDKALRGTALPIRSAQIKRLRANVPHTVRDCAANAFFRRNRGLWTDLDMHLFLPLFAKGEFVGAVALGRKLGGAPFRAAEKDVLRVVAHQMAITLHNSRLFRELAEKAAENRKLYTSMQRIYHDTIEAFAAAIDAKDEYTKEHSLRVASYAVAIARELGWKKREVEGLYIAGLLHDIGKIIIDVKVINKGAKLSAPEISEIRKHPQISYNILSKINFPWKNVGKFVLHHHERMDGTGYPHSLKEAELCDGVKILALVDAFDAMTSDRPYRDKLPLAEAFREVTRCKGTQFDEKITNTFFDLLGRELNGEVKDPQILPHLQNIDVARFNRGSGGRSQLTV